MYAVSSRFIQRTFIFIELPFWLKEFWGKADRSNTEIYNNLTWACFLIWAASYNLSFLYYVGFKVTSAAARTRRVGRAMISPELSDYPHLSRSVSALFGFYPRFLVLQYGVGHASSKRVEPQNEGSFNIRRVKTPAELKEVLLPDAALQEQFKQYLVREFCCMFGYSFSSPAFSRSF